MKRFIAALFLLAAILSISCWSLWDMKQSIDTLTQEARELRAAEPGEAALLEKSLQFVDTWNEAESHLIFYVHHDVLDHITQMITELPALAQYGEYGAFYSRTDTLIAFLDDMWKSAIPNHRNLL